MWYISVEAESRDEAWQWDRWWSREIGIGAFFVGGCWGGLGDREFGMAQRAEEMDKVGGGTCGGSEGASNGSISWCRSWAGLAGKAGPTAGIQIIEEWGGQLPYADVRG